MKKQKQKIDFFEEVLFPYNAPKDIDNDFNFEFEMPEFTMPDFTMDILGVEKSRTVETADQLKNEDGIQDIKLTSPRRITRDKKRVAAKNAESLAQTIYDSGKLGITRAIVTGTFVAGDFMDSIVALSGPSKVAIASYSFSRDNALMLCANIEDKLITSMDFIVSDFFYHQYKETLWQMLVTHARPSANIRYAICRLHAKLFLVIPDDKTKPAWSVEGSANLRSCDNIDQLVIEVDEQDKHEGVSFHTKWMNRIFERFEVKERRSVSSQELY